jgi:N-acyl-D-amino-acid deacylase
MKHFLRTILATGALPALPAILLAAAPPNTPDAAVRKGLRRLEQGATSYIGNRRCFSCHHQALTVTALTSAKRRGFRIDARVLKKQLAFTLDTFRPHHKQIVKGYKVAGGNTMAGYALLVLECAGHKPDASTAALVQYLLVRQRGDGSWPSLMLRPPSEGSRFTNAALALRALRTYGPKKGAKGADSLRKRVEAACKRGQGWLLKNKPKDTEDRVFRLRALVTIGAEARLIAAARRELLGQQKRDGSWAQLADRDGDAYATGTVLMALRQAGVKASDPAYRKAVRYLVRTQTPAGAWLVTSRSRPVQVFFDNGDPGGKSQFISFAATGWATLALLETFPER